MTALHGPDVWTVGHSDRPADALLDLLREAGIEHVFDVRTAPWSRRHPWHAKTALERSLGAAGIGYRWVGASLGGQPPQGFDRLRDGAGYALALDEVLREARQRRVALLCAERDPRHCHRGFIADDLARKGAIVWHLIDAGVVEAHQPPLV